MCSIFYCHDWSSKFYIALGLGPSSAALCLCIPEFMCIKQAMVLCHSDPLSTTGTSLLISQDIKSHSRHYPLVKSCDCQTSTQS